MELSAQLSRAQNESPARSPGPWRLRPPLVGILAAMFLLSVALWILSYARPIYTIQYLQPLPQIMQRPALPGTWAGSLRRYIFLEHGSFVGSVGEWWDVAPFPTSSNQLAGVGSGGGLRDKSLPLFRLIPGEYNPSGVSTGRNAEWVLPFWFPTSLSGALILLLYWPELRLFPTYRSRLRRRRGLCVQCSYNMAGLQPSACCPECGTMRA